VNAFSLKKGRNRMCLSRLGKYTLEPRSCHRFDIQAPIIYDTANPKPITLHAVAHQAVIVLETTKAYFDADVKEEKIPVQLRSSRGKGEIFFAFCVYTRKSKSSLTRKIVSIVIISFCLLKLFRGQSNF